MPDVLESARDALQSAAARASFTGTDEVARVVESLTSLVVLAHTIPNPPAPWVTETERIPLTTKSSVELGEAVRQRLGMDDVSPVFRLARIVPNRMRTLVFSVNLPAIDCACAIIAGTPLIAVANDLGFRQLVACARGLGHLMAITSRVRTANGAHIAPRSIRTSRRGGPAEYFAVNFAIELLIPTRGLAIALRRVREILKVKNRAVGDIEMLYLARIFGVTFSDIARKCERTQLLPLGGASAMSRFLDQEFGGPEKRADDLGLPERPGIEFPLAPVAFLSALHKRITAAELSSAQAAEALGTSEQALATALSPDAGGSESFWQ